MTLESSIIDPLGSEILLPQDYFFCRDCEELARNSYLEALVTRRLAANSRSLALTEIKSTSDRDPIVRREIEGLIESLAGRHLITSKTSDFRLGISTGFEVGTLGAPPAIDDREPDCHVWIDQQGPIDPDHFDKFKEEFRHRYSYAIPSRAALDAVAHYSPNGVVEIGAGNGYWKYLLEALGVKVRAIDRYLLSTNPFWGRRWASENRLWAMVNIGDVRNITKGNALRTLLLVWPPAEEAMANEALEAFMGDTAIYVGEWRAASGNNELHNLLKIGWELIDSIPMPTIFGFFDRMRIYKRRSEDVVQNICQVLSNAQRGKPT